MEDQTGHWPTWSDVKKWAKKTIKKIGEALEEAFVIEVGLGVGLEVSCSSSLVKFDIGAYQDGYTGGYANGDDYTSVKSSFGATATIAGVGFDGSIELEHRHETNGFWNRDGHNAFTSPFVLDDCASSRIEHPQGFSVMPECFSHKKAIVSESENDVFIGLSGSAHVVGGHFQVGINLTRFIEVFTDE